jgi:hypothetical protein
MIVSDLCKIMFYTCTSLNGDIGLAAQTDVHTSQEAHVYIDLALPLGHKMNFQAD